VSQCSSGSVRAMLLAEPSVSLRGSSIVLRAGDVEVVLSKSENQVVPLVAKRYRGSNGTSAKQTKLLIEGGTGLRSFGSPSACFPGTWIAFSKSRFVIDPYQIQVLTPGCRAVPTAYGLLLRNRSGTGRLTQKGSTLTLRFVDGAVATMTARR
jgi:hypothetical protein